MACVLEGNEPIVRMLLVRPGINVNAQQIVSILTYVKVFSVKAHYWCSFYVFWRMDLPHSRLLFVLVALHWWRCFWLALTLMLV